MEKIQELRTKPLLKAVKKTAVHAVQVFRHDTFYAALAKDFMNAKGLILCQSPYLSIRKIAELKPALQSAIKRGVRICVFAEQPREQPYNQVADGRKAAFEAAVTMLQDMGIHVTLRPKIHEKLVVIDEEVFWEGSLNPLSHLDTSERMNRWYDRAKVREAIRSHDLYGCLKCAGLAKALPTVTHSIGFVLARRRQKLGISQKHLAQSVKLGASHVCKIERGRENITIETLSHLCDRLELSIRIVPRYLAPMIDGILWNS